MSAGLLALSLAELELMTDEEFAEWWRELVGEPPVILLKDRAAMARVLVETLGYCRPKGSPFQRQKFRGNNELERVRSSSKLHGGSTAMTPSVRQGFI